MINFILASPNPFSQMRKFLIVIMFIASAVQYLRIRKGKKKVTEQEDLENVEKYYKKNEDGLYPWEVNTNDHPDSIPKNSKRMNNSWGPKRGKW